MFSNETMEPKFNKYDYLQRNINKQSGRNGNADKTSVNASSHMVSALGSSELHNLKIKSISLEIKI